MEFAIGYAVIGTGFLVKVAYNYLTKKTAKEKQFEAMEKDYPVTRYPVIPDILRHDVGWKTPNQFVGYAVGADNEQYASSESILFIQDYLNERLDEKKHIVPKNAVAVSQVFKDTFAVGTSCHEFVPLTFEPEPNAFFTFQMLLPTVQLAFYNVDGTAYLAGITYYLTPNNQDLVSVYSEYTTLNMATCLGAQYPSVDREETNAFKKWRQYGRYCNTAKKHVLVEITNEVAYHVVLLPREEKRAFMFCEECSEEYEKYEFVPKAWKKKVEEPVKEDAPANGSPSARQNCLDDAEMKTEKQFKAMEKDYPVTRYPMVPDILKHAAGWETQHEWVGYAVGAENEQYASDESILFIQDYLNERNMAGEDLLVPRNVLAVSQVHKTTFAVGNSCHEFVPKTFKSEPDAYFSYQMMGPTVQATYYNVDGTAYLAGVTYYLTPKSEKLVSLKCERFFVTNVLGSGLEWPPCDRKTDLMYENYRQYGRYCNTAKKHVVVKLLEDKVYHEVLVPRKDISILEFCEECTEEHKNYEFVPKAWKKKVEEPAVPATDKVETDVPTAKEVGETTPIEGKVEENKEEKKDEQVDEDLDDYEFLENETLDVLTIN